MFVNFHVSTGTMHGCISILRACVCVCVCVCCVCTVFAWLNEKKVLNTFFVNRGRGYFYHKFHEIGNPKRSVFLETCSEIIDFRKLEGKFLCVNEAHPTGTKGNSELAKAHVTFCYQPKGF
jgi:hypothetical protein